MADAKWYVVHTYSGYENKVANNIEKVVENRKMHDQILDVKIPTELVEYDDDDQPKMSDDSWYVIRHTRGVTGFVGPDNKPAPLSDEEIQKLGVEKRVVEVNYEVGDMVSIVDGIFGGFSGVVEEIDTENNVVKVTVSALFGKETMVELELDQVVVEAD